MDKSVKVSDENYKKVSKVAKEERRSIKTIMEIALENYFKRKEK